MLDWLFADPLLPGTPAPDFSLPDQDGKIVSLTALRGQNVVLVFYPGDDTTVRRQQLCEFRDRWAVLQQMNTLVFGVNPQNGQSHAKFIAKSRLPFPLLVDQGQKIGTLYKARGLVVRRTVYLIGPDGVIRFGQRGTPDPDQVLSHAAGLCIPKFYPILDTEMSGRYGVDPVSAAGDILEGGARILQFRHKGFFSREVFTQLERVAELCREAKALFVVNDRADLAALTGAALHLGQDDLAPSAARKVVGADTLIGFSTHNERQLRDAAAEPADYLALGPIFGTASKLNSDPVVGIDELRRLRPLTDRPLVAIGGITRANAQSVLFAGADAVAIIGDLFAERADMRIRTQEWVALTRDTQNV